MPLRRKPHLTLLLGLGFGVAVMVRVQSVRDGVRVRVRFWSVRVRARYFRRSGREPTISVSNFRRLNIPIYKLMIMKWKPASHNQ